MSIISSIFRALTGSTPRPALVQDNRTNVARTAVKIDAPRRVALATVELDALRPEIERVSFAIRQRIPVTLIHGRAGTGKTTLIRKIVEETELNHVVLAFTGVAALNAGGQTIHSFLDLPWGIINLNQITLKDQLRSIVRRLDFIVIDEISMVRADLLDSVDMPGPVCSDRFFGVLSEIIARRNRGGGNVEISFIDFQGLWKGRETVLSFSALSTDRHFHGRLRCALCRPC